MACGVPVIGTAAGGLPEVVEDGVSGFLPPVGDVEGMARGALALLEDAELWERFSRRPAAAPSWTSRRSPRLPLPRALREDARVLTAEGGDGPAPTRKTESW